MAEKPTKSAQNSPDEAIFVHESSVIDASAEIGSGTRVWHFCHVSENCRIGRDCVLGQNVYVGPGVVIGDRCKIQNNVSVYSGVTLEDEVFCGPSVVFTNVARPRAHTPGMERMRPTRIGRGATLGANCTVICGHDVGRHCLVGAGAVVAAAVPDHALVLGAPARQTGWVCVCGEGLDRELVCPACKAKYFKEGTGLVRCQ